MARGTIASSRCCLLLLLLRYFRYLLLSLGLVTINISKINISKWQQSEYSRYLLLSVSIRYISSQSVSLTFSISKLTLSKVGTDSCTLNEDNNVC